MHSAAYAAADADADRMNKFSVAVRCPLQLNRKLLKKFFLSFFRSHSRLGLWSLVSGRPTNGVLHLLLLHIELLSDNSFFLAFFFVRPTRATCIGCDVHVRSRCMLKIKTSQNWGVRALARIIIHYYWQWQPLGNLLYYSPLWVCR